MFRILANDASRTHRIAQDILVAYQEGRKILVLTERIEHLELLRDALGGGIEHCFVLHGRLSKKQRVAIFTALAELDDSAPRVLLATGRLIGEGFDHPPLDTLVLAMPISWKGTLQQYAGRLHREHKEKQDVRSTITSSKVKRSLSGCGISVGGGIGPWGLCFRGKIFLLGRFSLSAQGSLCKISPIYSEYNYPYEIQGENNGKR